MTPLPDRERERAGTSRDLKRERKTLQLFRDALESGGAPTVIFVGVLMECGFL